MQEITKETRLRAIVLSWTGNKKFCALMRVPKTSDRLDDQAVSLGFTEVEACGIMDGWDIAVGSYACCERNRCRDPEAYDRGRALGRQLATEALAAGTAVRIDQ